MTRKKMEYILKETKNPLIAFRFLNNLSQREVAEVLGVTKQRVSCLERTHIDSLRPATKVFLTAKLGVEYDQ